MTLWFEMNSIAIFSILTIDKLYIKNSKIEILYRYCIGLLRVQRVVKLANYFVSKENCQQIKMCQNVQMVNCTFVREK